MSAGIVFDVRRYAIHDGPGIRTAVFFKGCPLACRWCHNPEGQSPVAETAFRGTRCVACGACIEVCPHGAISRRADGGIETDRSVCVRCGACVEACYADARQTIGYEVSPEAVADEIARDVPFYERSGGGATFSGGEPLMQIDFLDELLDACRARGIHTALDTCGYAPWEAIERIRRRVDLFLYDVKVVDDARHRELTGVSNEIILGNLRALSGLGHAIRLRVAIIPGMNDDDESIRAIGALAGGLPRLDEIDILSYNRMGIDKYARLGRSYTLPDAPAVSGERLAAIVRTLGGFGVRVRAGG